MEDVTKRIFCGGTFCFDCRNEGYETMAAVDYRAELLGSVEALLRPTDEKELKLFPGVVYVGPFYFETEAMEAEDIIRQEKKMVECCTDAIFVLDDAACPGTIAEIMHANALKKNLHLFYVGHDESEETESELHTPCWYPILFCKMTNDQVFLYPCNDVEDAKQKVMDLVTTKMAM